MVNSAFRAFRYPADHPAFKDRELTPNGTITERAEKGIDSYRQRPPGDRPQGKGGGGDRRGNQAQQGGQRRSGGVGQRDIGDDARPPKQ